MDYEMSSKAQVFRKLVSATGANTRNFLARKYPCSEKPAPRKTFHNSINNKKYVCA